ncbi:LysR family transcriptional regulator [Cytobacillus solani]|uniref:LysR family transcriptional regulator n=1 Tax=Cytobacillus solani TaxID=1637975 RepID=A0A0Q3VG15_9BACI|nr:LysR family transcriptional regulator [Cytobacillus solani]KOP81364.1 LysR family transcriptional regulator [Bacillus sp. FJAT-21945]KQL18355.1 LysR family transcriptional regulator [Cytobacillus solani]
MNIEWLHSFAEAAKQKSFSKAAKANNLSQPALSKHIRNLENNLDIELFHRTSTGIELTEAGERFYTRITPVISELTAIHQELQQFCRTNPIAIGSLPSLATYYLPSRIKGLRLLGRPLTLMIQNTSSELLQSLQEGRLDAVFVEALNTRESLWSCELFTEPYYAVFPLDHRFKSKKTVELAELCEEPLIAHQAPCDTRKHIIEQMASLGYKPNIISEVAFGDFIFGAVTAGMGITIVPELMAKNIGHLELFALPIDNFGRKRTVSLVARNNKLGSKLYQFLSGID